MQESESGKIGIIPSQEGCLIMKPSESAKRQQQLDTYLIEKNIYI